MNRVQVLQMMLQVLQLLVTMMLLTVELRRLCAKAREEGNLHGAGAEPQAPPGDHMFIPLFVTPALAAAARLAFPGASATAMSRDPTTPWTAPSPTSSRPIALAASR